MRIKSCLLVMGMLLPMTGVQAETLYRCSKYGRTFVQTVPCQAPSTAPGEGAGRNAARQGQDAGGGAAAPAAAKSRMPLAPIGTGAAMSGVPGKAAPLVGAARSMRQNAAPSEVSLPWAGLQRGMRLASVRRLVPAAVPREGVGRLINGAQVQLSRPNVKFGGFDYRADYYFLEGAFLQISLKKADEQPQSNEAVRREYEALARVLVDALGPPTTNKAIVQNHFSLSAGMEWELPGNDKAWLAIIPVDRERAHITFGFRPDSSWRLQRIEAARPGGAMLGER